jgi:hypothetical protein
MFSMLFVNHIEMRVRAYEYLLTLVIEVGTLGDLLEVFGSIFLPRPE